MLNFRAQTYNLVYAKAPQSFEEALHIAVKCAEWIFGEEKMSRYEIKKVSLEDGRWKIYFMLHQYNWDEIKTEKNKGIELHIGTKSGEVMYYNLNE